MAADLVIAPEAEHDLASAYTWYEGQSVGLGEEFLRSVDARIQAILRSPEMHPIVFENYRRSLVRKFPYAVIYEYANDTVNVYAVVHNSRDPQKWRKRLP